MPGLQGDSIGLTLPYLYRSHLRLVQWPSLVIRSTEEDSKIYEFVKSRKSAVCGVVSFFSPCSKVGTRCEGTYTSPALFNAFSVALCACISLVLTMISLKIEQRNLLDGYSGITLYPSLPLILFPSRTSNCKHFLLIPLVFRSDYVFKHVPIYVLNPSTLAMSVLYHDNGRTSS